MLFELGVHTPVVTTQASIPILAFDGRTVDRLRTPAVGVQLVWSVGAMKNQDGVSAVGGSLLAGAGNGGPFFGAQARYRRWLSQTGSAEVAVGPAAIEVPIPARSTEYVGYADRFRLGAAADARLNYADRVAASVRVIAVPVGRRVHGGVLVGGSTGTGVAIAGTVGVAAFFAFLYVALSGAYT